MAILSFPSIVPEIQTFGVKYNTQVSTTTLSGIVQSVELPGARWNGSISFSDMTPIESAALKVFMLKLRGSSGRFFYGDQTHTAPFNTVTGSPSILGGSTARVIAITLAASSPPFVPGDYIQIGSDDQRELKMIVASNNTGGDNYDLTLEPMIRRTDYVSQQIFFTNPTGVFFLSADDQASWGSRSKALLSDMTLDFVEIFL